MGRVIFGGKSRRLTMSTATVSAQIDEEVKRKAEEVLRQKGCTAADLIQWTMTCVAEGKTVPFEIPNAETVAATEAARRGETVKVGGAEGLMAWLEDADD
jgi:DNA-damage-inducible protein J